VRPWLSRKLFASSTVSRGTSEKILIFLGGTTLLIPGRRKGETYTSTIHSSGSPSSTIFERNQLLEFTSQQHVLSAMDSQTPEHNNTQDPGTSEIDHCGSFSLCGSDTKSDSASQIYLVPRHAPKAACLFGRDLHHHSFLACRLLAQEIRNPSFVSDDFWGRLCSRFSQKIG
jgi:hypothetical protein